MSTDRFSVFFFPTRQDTMRIHYENNTPFLTISSITRTIEVSHWGNIAVEETVDLRHTGAVLKGPFSRYDYQRQSDSGISSVKSFKVSYFFRSSCSSSLGWCFFSRLHLFSPADHPSCLSSRCLLQGWDRQHLHLPPAGSGRLRGGGGQATFPFVWRLENPLHHRLQSAKLWIPVHSGWVLMIQGENDK